MGYIPSAETVYSVAYLTEIGRAYLFNENNNRFDANGDDLFEITKFTLSDTDTNYQTVQLLETGEVPDVTGKSEGCLKTAANYVQTNLISFIFDGSPTNVEYNTSLPSPNNTLIVSETSIPDISPGETPPTPLPTSGGGSAGPIGPGRGTGGAPQIN